MHRYLTIFILFYSAYGIAHLYAFLKIKSTFNTDAPASVFLGLLLLFMTFLTYLIHVCSTRASLKTIRVLSYINYTWMALLFFFFSISLSIDIYNLAIRLAGFILQKDLASLMPSLLTSFYVPLLLSVLFSIYGYWEAKVLKVKRLSINTTKLPEGTDKLTIAQISDLHLGIMVKDEILDKVIKEIKKAKPDLIVSTGDLLDEEVNHIDYLSEKLKKVYAGLGKFAVTGNHEFYGGIKNSIKFLEDSGFTVLRGRGITVKGLINIAGSDDPICRKEHNPGNIPSESKILSSLPSDIFTLLLKHRPDTDKNSLGLFDLQLSGHTHGGQSFPINLAILPFFRHKTGYKNLAKGSSVYVSQGTGTVCMPIRFLAPPEIVIIDVISGGKPEMQH